MKNFKKGFTLIELLVVIAIIGILATVIIVNVSGARDKATKSKVASDLSTGVKIYAACQTFGGIPQTIPTAGLAGNVICKTLPTDSVEAASASGDWPNLTGLYAYITPGAGNLIAVTDGAPAPQSMACTVNGCGSWH